MTETRKGLWLLREAMKRNNSLVCCGLDPDVLKIPLEFSREHGAVGALKAFLQEVIDATAPHICAYKAQKAFFDLYPEGHGLLLDTVTYIHRKHPHLPVFVDAKIGDIENTMEVYLQTIFNGLGADGVVVNPYLGDDVFRPFGQYPDKAIIVTVRTSNPGASVVQDAILQDGRPLWRHVLDLCVGRWNAEGNVVPVIASTTSVDLGMVRRAIPKNMPVLLAGYGAQGGAVEQLRDLVDASGRGVFVNSSRGLLYPFETHDPKWRDGLVHAVVAMKNELNFAKSRSKILLILGVSGAGKSTIIRELCKIDSRYRRILPFMTRGLRPGETDKIAVSDAELEDVERQGDILVTNELYGIRYATPREPIMDAFREEVFPVLDWPIDQIGTMQQAFSGRLFTVYVEPPDMGTLEERLKDGRDRDEVRLVAAKTELTALFGGAYDGLYDCRVVNAEGQSTHIAQRVHQTYIQKVGF